MTRALEVMAEEISQSLFREVQSIEDIRSPDASFADLLARRLAREVLSRLRGDSPSGATSLYQDLDARLGSTGGPDGAAAHESYSTCGTSGAG